MDESEFHQRVDDVIESIQDQLDDIDTDIDYEAAGGILTITFTNGTKIIINRQTPVKQIWMATKAGGFHFNFSDEVDAWVKDDDGTELFSALAKYCFEQSGENIEFNV